MEITQTSLLERLRCAPDERSWKRLVDVYSPFLLRVLRAEGVTETDANDLLQEVFVVVVAEMPNFNHSGQVGAFRHWLRAIVINRLRRHWTERKNSQRLGLGSEAALETVADEFSELHRIWDVEHNQWITGRILELIEPEFKPSSWQAFLRLVMHSAKPGDVAQELGLSVNAVLIAKSRILRRLREEFSGLAGDWEPH